MSDPAPIRVVRWDAILALYSALTLLLADQCAGVFVIVLRLCCGRAGEHTRKDVVDMLERVFESSSSRPVALVPLFSLVCNLDSRRQLQDFLPCSVQNMGRNRSEILRASCCASALKVNNTATRIQYGISVPVESCSNVNSYCSKLDPAKRSRNQVQHIGGDATEKRHDLLMYETRLRERFTSLSLLKKETTCAIPTLQQLRKRPFSNI